MCKLVLKNPKTLDKEKIAVINKRRAFNKAIGSEKNPKLINVGPTFIPDYRVCRCFKAELEYGG